MPAAADGHALWYRGAVTLLAASAQPAPAPEDEPAEVRVPSASEVRARLELLEELYREGHLAEEVFRAKRDALLRLAAGQAGRG